MLPWLQGQPSSSAVGAVVGGAGAASPARGAAPRVLNPQAGHAQHRPPRPRTPIHHQLQVLPQLCYNYATKLQLL